MSEFVDLLLSAGRDPNEEILLEIEASHSVSAGWQCGPDYILEGISTRLSEEYGNREFSYVIGHQFVDLQFRSQRVRVNAHRNHRLCFNLIRGANSIMSGSYEIRSMKYRNEESFRTFVLASSDQWRHVSQAEPSSEQFEKITNDSGFFLDKYSWPVAFLLEKFLALIIRIFVVIFVRRQFRDR